MTSVAQVLVVGLKEAGTPRLFGVPGGGSSLELLEAARAEGLPFVLVHQESAAAIMAAVTGELTGRPGAALVSLGPGAASAVNGVTYAWLDRAPLIVVTDRHPEAARAFTTHQTLDQVALFRPVTKASVCVTPESGASAIAEAVRLSLSEPRGPVHLDLPSDVAGKEALPAAPLVVPAATTAPGARELDRAAELIGTASRPVVIAGLECRGVEEAKWLRAMAEALPVPVLTTYKAKGILPDAHPLALGVFTGGVLDEAVVGLADLIITLGLDPVELIPRPWPYAAPVVHLSRVPHAGHYFTPLAEVVGDLALILEELAPRLRKKTRVDWDMAQIDRLKKTQRQRLAVATPGLAPHRVVQICRQGSPTGALATVDAGAHMFPATTFWEAEDPGGFLISNGLATMGFALPAAIAAQLVHPERRVVCFTGDAGLGMVAAEMETVRRLELPIVIVVFDDLSLSLIRVKQEQKGYPETAMTYGGPDFQALARSFGLAAFVASDERQLGAAFAEALAASAPALVDARIDPSGYRRILEVVRGVPRDG